MIDKYKTPYKYGLPVLSPSGVPGDYNSHGVDCPFVFLHGGRIRMLHVGYNGKGYQTALASSDHPLRGFKTDAVVLRSGEGSGWDMRNAAGVWILSDSDFGRPRTLKKFRDRYWMLYHSYPGEGYETGPARMGLAWCEDEDLLRWTRLEEPVLVPEDGADWENGGLYKGCIIEHGGQFYMFYNAKDQRKPWTEQTGVAVSEDLLHWHRYDRNPVLEVTPGAPDARFASDPCVCLDGERWLMFYFGFDGKKAVDMLATGTGPYDWRREGVLIDTGEPGAIDSMHAHKPSMFSYEGTLYHYYCACRPRQPGDVLPEDMDHFRCITAAADRPVFQSAVSE